MERQSGSSLKILDLLLGEAKLESILVRLDGSSSIRKGKLLKVHSSRFFPQ
jgi:hypothetical protein